jgi:hypothetical protein
VAESELTGSVGVPASAMASDADESDLTEFVVSASEVCGCWARATPGATVAIAAAKSRK